MTLTCEECRRHRGTHCDGGVYCDACFIYRVIKAVGVELGRRDFVRARTELDRLPRGRAASTQIQRSRLVFAGLIEEKYGDLDLALAFYTRALRWADLNCRFTCVESQSRILRKMGRNDEARRTLIAALDSTTNARAEFVVSLLASLAELGAGPSDVPGWWAHWRASARAHGVPKKLMDMTVDPIDAMRLLKQVASGSAP